MINLSTLLYYAMENNSKDSNIRFTFSKDERLCNKKLFDKLFVDGISFSVYPLKIIFIETDHSSEYPARAAFAVSKKFFRKAVTRNLLKRRIREAYRLNKHNLYSRARDRKLVLIFIYVGKEIMDYRRIESSMQQALNILAERIS